MQRVRPALKEIQRQIGLKHALASRRLYTDGAELLFDYAQQHPTKGPGPTTKDLVVVRNGQRVFATVIEQYLPAHSVRPRRLRNRYPDPCISFCRGRS